jgi:hypothetical protein
MHEGQGAQQPARQRQALQRLLRLTAARAQQHCRQPQVLLRQQVLLLLLLGCPTTLQLSARLATQQAEHRQQQQGRLGRGRPTCSKCCHWHLRRRQQQQKV